MNTKQIGALEKVLVICISLIVIISIICFSVGIITSDTAANPAELTHNVYRVLGIVTTILIGCDMCSAYIELNKKRFN